MKKLDLSDPKFVRTDGDNLQKLVSDATSISFEHPEDDLNHPSRSRTQQSFADECDINNIMARYEQTGLLPENPFEPRFGDTTMLPAFHEAQNIIATANETFAALPAKIRERFHNDPAQYLDFFSNDENFDEAVRLGLVNPLQEPQEAPQAPEAPTPSGDS